MEITADSAPVGHGVPRDSRPGAQAHRAVAQGPLTNLYAGANASPGTCSKWARLRVSRAADRATQIPAIM